MYSWIRMYVHVQVHVHHVHVHLHVRVRSYILKSRSLTDLAVDTDEAIRTVVTAVLPDCLPLHTLSSVLTRSVVYTNLRNVTEVSSVASVTVASFQRAVVSRDAGSVLRARIARLTHVH